MAAYKPPSKRRGNKWRWDEEEKKPHEQIQMVVKPHVEACNIDHWHCVNKTCKFELPLNKIQTHCPICMVSREGKLCEAKNNTLQQNLPKKNNMPRTVWKCARCENQNEANSDYCVLCGTPSPRTLSNDFKGGKKLKRKSRKSKKSRKSRKN